MITIKLCGITALFDVFMETNKRHNLTRLVGSFLGLPDKDCELTTI